ncbi:hypothetical protein [Streptomyces spirodelae]|uniref:hypothetical protein n=1 Tax=Streptomyces spirodelae TaxID=2812904 RepID=UPI001E41FF10|nr:hypothetical protein [Streptomyces spirodelae]
MTGQLVVLRGRLWVNASGDAHFRQCVARTRKGGRCQNPIEYGQVMGFREFQLGPAGYVYAYGCYGPHGAVDDDRWLAQHCTLHDTPDVVDCETPELRRFDIIRDSSFIKPYRVDAAYDGTAAVDCDPPGVAAKPPAVRPVGPVGVNGANRQPIR